LQPRQSSVNLGPERNPSGAKKKADRHRRELPPLARSRIEIKLSACTRENSSTDGVALLYAATAVP